MSLIEKAASLVGMSDRSAPVGTVRVVDYSPLNWLYITYNTVEELVRVSPQGKAIPAAMDMYHWIDNQTLEITIKAGNVFQDGTPLASASVKRSFDEVMRWQSPHPPGTQFNLWPGTRFEMIDDRKFRLHFPRPDGLALGKLRAMHLMDDRFWDGISFGYQRNGSGEGHW